MNESTKKTLYHYSVNLNRQNEAGGHYNKDIILCDFVENLKYESYRGQRINHFPGVIRKNSLGRVLSIHGNIFFVTLEKENDELAKSLLAEKVRARHEELKALYDASNNTLRFLEKGPREQKERKERADRDDFEKIVLFLAETWYETRDNNVESEISAFEEAIQEHGRDVAYFGTAKSHWNAIQIAYYTYHNPPFFTADYDDRTVCEWEGSYEEFERLFRETAPTVYEMYRARFPEHVDTESRDSSLTLS